jgi:hypothetical protein
LGSATGEAGSARSKWMSLQNGLDQAIFSVTATVFPPTTVLSRPNSGLA